MRFEMEEHVQGNSSETYALIGTPIAQCIWDGFDGSHFGGYLFGLWRRTDRRGGTQDSGTHPYRRQYARKPGGKGALVGVGARAGLNQVRNIPKQWGGGAAGFGKRLASGMGTHVVKNTIQFAVAAARHEYLAYHPPNMKGFKPRMRHALLSIVIMVRRQLERKPWPRAGFRERWAAV